jgi:hypothetical protein
MGGHSLHHLANHLRRDGRLRECVMVDQPMTATHTPAPWFVRKGALPGVIVDDAGDQLAAAFSDVTGGNAKRNANAAFIVEAVNSHASLKARIAELEANEKTYEEIIGKKTFREVADRIRELEDALQLLDLLLDFSDDNVDPVWTFEDTTSIQTAFARAYAALQPKDIAP